MKLRNSSWKRQRFFFLKKERGWTSKLFSVLSFSKNVVYSLMVGFVYVSWSVFYGFSGIIILGFLTNQNTRTNNGDLFTCNDFNVWVENVY